MEREEIMTHLGYEHIAPMERVNNDDLFLNDTQ
jgi:hypothetical protein